MLSRIGEVQAPLPAPAALLIGMLTAIVVHGPALWNVATHVNTVVHEGAHAVVGLGTGHRIRGVTIARDGGGGTEMVPDSGLGFACAAFAGYIGPSVAGLIAAGLISIGRIIIVLWLGLLLLAAMLLMVRNWFGGTVILACGVLLYLLLRYTAVGVETTFAYSVTWFLLVSGPKAVLGAGSKPADAAILARITILWPSAWSFLWLIGTIVALVGGAAILV